MKPIVFNHTGHKELWDWLSKNPTMKKVTGQDGNGMRGLITQQVSALPVITRGIATLMNTNMITRQYVKTVQSNGLELVIVRKAYTENGMRHYIVKNMMKQQGLLRKSETFR